jgi:hypothetical protein
VTGGSALAPSRLEVVESGSDVTGDHTAIRVRRLELAAGGRLLPLADGGSERTEATTNLAVRAVGNCSLRNIVASF